MKSSTGEREFFSVSPFASEGKTDEVKEFTIVERTVKVCLLHFRLEKCSLVLTMGVVEVQLLGDSTVIFALCDSV